MNKNRMLAIAVSFVVALIISVSQAATSTPAEIDGLAAIAAVDGGKTWTAVYEKNQIAFYLLGDNGIIQKSFSIPRSSGGYLVQVAHMAVDTEGSVYFIKQYISESDGKYDTRQELSVYTPKLLPFGRLNTIRLDSKEDPGNIRYTHLNLSTSLVLIGMSGDDSQIVRKTYDLNSLKTAGVTVKNIRTYPALTDDGIYKMVAAGTDVAYISKSGKVFLSKEATESPILIYPDSEAQLSSFASFICESTSGQVTVGEQRSGNILKLNTSGGGAEYLMEGGQAFGTLPYTGKDVLEMSFCPENDASYTAVVSNKNTGVSELVVSNRGNISLITKVDSGVITSALRIAGSTALYFLGILAAIGLFIVIRRLIAYSRTIFVKLISSSIPLLVLALVLFGAYSYFSYQSSLNSTYKTKAADQGNLLRALLSSSSFDKITSPGLYASTEYNYLRAQMGTRDVYTSSAYFVDGKLYTGIDRDLPSLYPFGIRRSATAQELYRQAALTGKQQTGVITDHFGDRIACITPVGSSSGNMVFLLETSVFQAEINRQAGGFIRNYLIVSLLCLIASCALLLATFLRTLRPLGNIVEAMGEFTGGNRSVRLESDTNDELADIARVFNKMAKDIDIQIYNLRQMGETYYRFVPQQIFQLLGKDNLAGIELGNAVEGKFCILVANLHPRQGRMDFSSMQELTNRFFTIVHKVCNENGATLLSDSVGLRDLRIICQSGDAAVRAAMDATAQIDGHNAKSAISRRLDVSFFLHYTQMGFGICGDEERFVPAMISSELDGVLERCEDFRRFSSRLIVTETAYKILDAGRYFNRFIGYAGDEEEDRIGLYDFYDSSSASLIRLLNDTRSTFDKAMGLYHQKRFYDAKNLFAVVLRENQYDNVARHYVFKCERNL